MGYLPSPRAQVKDNAAGVVIPDSAQLPAAHTDFMKIVGAIESNLVLRLPSIAQATTAPYDLSPLQNGMIVVTTSAPYEVYFRANGAWVKIYPRIYNGTTVPSAALGVDDDLYIQY